MEKGVVGLRSLSLSPPWRWGGHGQMGVRVSCNHREDLEAQGYIC